MLVWSESLRTNDRSMRHLNERPFSDCAGLGCDRENSEPCLAYGTDRSADRSGLPGVSACPWAAAERDEEGGERELLQTPR